MLHLPGDRFSWSSTDHRSGSGSQSLQDDRSRSRDSDSSFSSSWSSGGSSGGAAGNYNSQSRASVNQNLDNGYYHGQGSSLSMWGERTPSDEPSSSRSEPSNEGVSGGNSNRNTESRSQYGSDGSYTFIRRGSLVGGSSPDRGQPSSSGGQTIVEGSFDNHGGSYSIRGSRNEPGGAALVFEGQPTGSDQLTGSGQRRGGQQRAGTGQSYWGRSESTSFSHHSGGRAAKSALTNRLASFLCMESTACS